MASKSLVVEGSSVTASQLKDLFRQIEDGSLSRTHVQSFLDHRDPFAIDMSREGQLANWGTLLKSLFGLEINSTSIPIPEPVAGFDLLIVVPQGLTLNRIIEVCRAKFENVYLAYEDLDKAVVKSDRTNDKTYAIWVRDRVEADEELKNLSAEDLAEQKISGLTLMERLLYELKYHEETGNHLDLENMTLCQGSRYSGGGVPYVLWSRGSRRLYVYSYDPGYQNAYLRGRQVVS